jgi:ABC-2 type transport system ATP-binding protein
VLLHEPPILFLDEPTIGLDVVAKHAVLDFLETLSTEKGTTILFTSHNLSDVERLCKRIIILDRGKVILDAAREAILARFGQQRRLVVEFQGTVGQIDTPYGEIVQQEANKVWIAFNRDEVSAFDLIGALGQGVAVNGQRIKDITIVESDIESIVSQIYEHGMPDATTQEAGDAVPASR